ncbi:MAG: hypothetical protein R3Y28_05585 [Candidatus Gastranaerophilales bacterium]
MKKLTIILTILLAVFLNTQLPSSASLFNKDAGYTTQKQDKNALKELKKLINTQNQYSNEHDIDKLTTLYSEKFVNSDGFNKEVYFKLIEDTWISYPDIKYASKINNIDIVGNNATIYVEENAYAIEKSYSDDEETQGQLFSLGECVYFVEKIGEKWFLIGEKIIKETSVLKYGDAKSIYIDLSVPAQVAAGQEYTATLKVNTRSNELALASINNEEITYPQSHKEDNYRKLSESNTLERVFIANSNNTNEYATASVGIATSEIYDKTKLKVYMSGLAFIVTRLNVLPQNNFVDLEKAKIEKTTKVEVINENKNQKEKSEENTEEKSDKAEEAETVDKIEGVEETDKTDTTNTTNTTNDTEVNEINGVDDAKVE